MPLVNEARAKSCQPEPIVWYWAVLLFAVHGAFQFFHLEHLQAQPPKNFPRTGDEFFYIAGAVTIIAGIPFALLLPTLRAGGMARHWGVPSTTLLLSRPLLQFFCSAAIGVAAGGVLVAPFVGLKFLPLIGAAVITAVCMGAATRRRFRRHRCTEWTMPPPGYDIMRPLIRGSRPDVDAHEDGLDREEEWVDSRTTN